jgi:heme/copper-type cytochrome/quinol oxidase subunit 3
MAQIVNQNSFLLLVIGLWVMAAVLILRRSTDQWALISLGAVTVVLAVVFLALRPAAVEDPGAAGVRNQIGAGMPVLLEVRSPN